MNPPGFFLCLCLCFGVFFFLGGNLTKIVLSPWSAFFLGKEGPGHLREILRSETFKTVHKRDPNPKSPPETTNTFSPLHQPKITMSEVLLYVMNLLRNVGMKRLRCLGILCPQVSQPPQPSQNPKATKIWMCSVRHLRCSHGNVASRNKRT